MSEVPEMASTADLVEFLAGEMSPWVGDALEQIRQRSPHLLIPYRERAAAVLRQLRSALAEPQVGEADDPRLKQLADALRIFVCIHWDGEEISNLGDLEEEDQKWIGAADWHAGDLFDRKLLASHGLPSGEYTTYSTGAGDRFLKEALALAARITQPGLFEHPETAAPEPQQEVADERDLEYELHEEQCAHGGTLMKVDRLLEAVRPFTVDGGVSCGSDDADRLCEVVAEFDADPKFKRSDRQGERP